MTENVQVDALLTRAVALIAESRAQAHIRRTDLQLKSLCDAIEALAQAVRVAAAQR
jgi:hypothetical protein